MTNFGSIDPNQAGPDGLQPPAAGHYTILAQQTFSKLFAILEDADWRNNPRGPLAYHWNTATGQSATYLINLAWNLNRIYNGVPVESRVRLLPKFNSLLYPTD
jgi:hypothetical protein